MYFLVEKYRFHLQVNIFTGISTKLDYWIVWDCISGFFGEIFLTIIYGMAWNPILNMLNGKMLEDATWFKQKHLNCI